MNPRSASSPNELPAKDPWTEVDGVPCFDPYPLTPEDENVVRKLVEKVEIRRGDLVEVTTAGGETVKMRALGGRTAGHDFPIVLVCTPEEWDSSDDPEGIPWPTKHVRLVDQEDEQ